MILAVPMGQLADRIGRAPVFVAGYALLLLLYVLLISPSWGSAEVFVYLLLFGAYYAATDGVLMAAASAVLPTSLRGSGLALLVTATSLAPLRFARLRCDLVVVRAGDGGCHLCDRPGRRGRGGSCCAAAADRRIRSCVDARRHSSP